MKHPFKVGNVYKNRQGEYEVVYLDDRQDMMTIRYLNSGEEVQTSVTRQERIWQNMGWEEQAKAQQQETAEARYQQGYGEDFTGLMESDFKTSTEGTTWRSRRGLAGRVAQLLSVNTPYTFISWAIYGWPVAFLTHREDYKIAAFEFGSRKAKFTIELDEANTYYGLYVERNDGPMDRSWDWLRLLPALHTNATLQKGLTEAEEKHNIRFLARIFKGEGHFHFADGLAKGAHSLWDEASPAAIPITERLHLLAEIPADHWSELYFIATTPKTEALAAGVQLAYTMADAMRHLLPLYTAAVRD